MGEPGRPLAAGDRCLCSCEGPWAHGTVRRVNEDGGFDVELDEKSMKILKLWHGVTRAEISTSDEACWPAVFARLAPAGSFGMADFRAALAATGSRVEPDRVDAYFEATVAELLHLEKAAARDARLDAKKAYQLVRRAGLSAAAFDLDPRRPGPMYWNQTRMGGRDPSELPRPVELSDAYDALGLRDVEDPRAVAAIVALETKLGVVVPDALRALATRADAAEAVKNAHPNDPSLLPIEAWSRATTEHGEVLVFLEPHQGGHVWAVGLAPAAPRVFIVTLDDDDESEAAYTTHTANDVAFFVWDLAQTGLAWWQSTGYRGGKRIRRTDVGIAPA